MAAQLKGKRRRKHLSPIEKERLTLQVAYLLCEEERKLSEIATLLGLSRSTVIRLIEEGESRGFITKTKPTFTPPKNYELERRLRQHFRLKEAVVSHRPDRDDRVRSVLAAAAASYLKEVLQRDRGQQLSIGMSGGMTMLELVDNLAQVEPTSKTSIYPLHFLERTRRPDWATGGVVITRLAEKLKSENYRTPLDYVEQKTVDLWDAELELLKKLKMYRSTVEAWKSLDVALMSVAPFRPDSLTVQCLQGGLHWKETSDVTAVLNLAPLTNSGTIAKDFFLSIPTETLRRLASDPARDIILVAGGTSYQGHHPKVEAIRIILEARLANVLVTDEVTASQLLETRHSSS